MDTRVLGDKPSGVGIYAYNFIKALQKYDDLEFYLITDVVKSDQIIELSGYVNIHILSYGRKVSLNAGVLRYFGFIKKMIHQVKPDIFWEVNNLSPVKIKNPYGKYIVTINDVFPMYMPDCFIPGYKYYFQYGVSRTLRDVDAVIYISEDTRHQVEKYFKCSRNLQCYVGYIIIPTVPQVQVERTNQYLYLGNFEKRKGSDILLDGIKKYIDLGGTRQFILAGKVRESDIQMKLDVLLDTYPNQVKYVGYVDDDMRIKLYNQCQCFIFPSRAEGFGMPIIEAMSCGEDIIASDLDIFQEISGEAIKYFRLQSAVDGLVKALFTYEKTGDDQKRDMCDAVIHKYSEQVLGQSMYEFLRQVKD